MQRCILLIYYHSTHKEWQDFLYIDQYFSLGSECSICLHCLVGSKCHTPALLLRIKSIVSVSNEILMNIFKILQSFLDIRIWTNYNSKGFQIMLGMKITKKKKKIPSPAFGYKCFQFYWVIAMYTLILGRSAGV